MMELRPGTDHGQPAAVAERRHDEGLSMSSGPNVRPDERQPGLGSMDSIHTVLRQAPFLFFGQLYMNAASLASTMLLTRAFDPASFGLVTLATSIVNLLAPFGLLGLNAGLERFTAFLGGDASWDHVQALRRKTFRFLAVLNFVLFVPVAMGSALVGDRLFHKSHLGVIVSALAVSLQFNWMNTATAAVFTGLRRMSIVALISCVLPATGNLVIAVAFYCLGLNSPLNWAVCMSLMYLVVSMASLQAWRRVAPVSGERTASAQTDLRAVLAFSLPLFFTTLVLVIHQNFDLVLLGRFHTTGDVAEYRICKYFPLFLFQTLGAILAVVQPEIAALIGARAARTLLRQFYLRIAKWEIIIASLMSLLIFTFSPLLLPLLFGPDYRVNDPLTLLLLLGVPWLVGLAGPCAAALLAHGCTRLLMFNGCVSAAVGVTLALWLVPKYGPLGAAVASLSNMGLTQGLAFVQAYCRLGLQPYGARLLGFVGIAVAAAFGGGVPQFLYPASHRAVCSVAGLLAAGCLTGSIFLLRLIDAEDVALLNKIRAAAARTVVSLCPLLPISCV